MKTPQRYSAVARILHWSVAALIVVQYLLAELAKWAEQQSQPLEQLALLANHKSIGITIFGLAIARIAWRIMVPPPTLPQTMPVWQLRSAAIAHALLYLLLFALPITGWLMSSAKSYSVSWFNLIVLPDFIGPSADLADQLVNMHILLGDALLFLAAIHIGAALMHALAHRDGVLSRMLDARSGLLFLLLLMGTAWQFASIEKTAVDSGVTTTSSPASEQQIQAEASELPGWQIDNAVSSIMFTGDQAGAPFEGVWETWAADIRFDAQNLDDSSMDVIIEVGSVDTGDAERDGYILSDAFFNQAVFGQARFYTTEIIATELGFSANATLSIKGITLPLVFDFSVNQEGQQRELNGNARIDRLAWELGTGDWTDTTWVGQYVDVKVTVKATVE